MTAPQYFKTDAIFVQGYMVAEGSVDFDAGVVLFEIVNEIGEKRSVVYRFILPGPKPSEEIFKGLYTNLQNRVNDLCDLCHDI